MVCFPFLPSVPPESQYSARRTGTGTSVGSEEKQETIARQRFGAPPLRHPLNLTAQQWTYPLLSIAGEEDTNTKRPACWLFCFITKENLPGFLSWALFPARWRSPPVPNYGTFGRADRQSRSSRIFSMHRQKSSKIMCSIAFEKSLLFCSSQESRRVDVVGTQPGLASVRRVSCAIEMHAAIGVHFCQTLYLRTYFFRACFCGCLPLLPKFFHGCVRSFF